MVVNGIGAFTSRRASALSRSAEEPAHAEQRALVPVPAVAPSENPRPYSRRPAAPFLAQLIATQRGEPQTRARRRAAADTAAHAYTAMLQLSGTNSRKS